MSQEKSYFPHLIIGNVKKVSQDYISNYLIPFTLAPSTVLTEIMHGVDHNKNLTDIKTGLKSNIELETLVYNKTILLETFPEFSQYTEELNNYSGIGTAPTLTISPETGDKVIDLWESVFYFYTLNNEKDESILFDLILALKIIYLSSQSMSGEELIIWWNRSQLLFPNPPFPLPKPAPKVVSGTIPTVEADTNIIKSKLADIQTARTEILNLFDKQLELQKTQKTTLENFSALLVHNTTETYEIPANQIIESTEDQYERYLNATTGEKLSDNSISSLSSEINDTLGEYGINLEISDLTYALNRLDVETRKLVDALPYQTKYDQIILIGNTLIAVDDAVYGKIICEEDTSLSHCALLNALSAENPEKTYVQVLGIGLANVIRQKIIRHEADEIAHIESVLDGESKVKTHRNLKIQEDFSYSELEKNQETETDTKSTSRFELAKEVSNIVNEDQQFQAGVQITASWGPTISVGANVGYATGSSSSEASSTSVKMSKDISERAVKRIQERALEIKESRSINEVEVTNVHTIENHHETGHINGFYYWVDKVYENQVYNLGKRLMLEVMIPEPAAYHIFSSAVNKMNGNSLSKPIHPNKYKGDDLENPLTSFKSLNRSNYAIWAAKYDVQNVSPPPVEILTVSGSYVLDYLPENKGWNDFSFKDISVSDGYVAATGRISVGFSGGDGNYITGFLGNAYFNVSSTQITPVILTLNSETGFVPLSFRGKFSEYHMNVEVLTKLTLEGFDKWRIDTYNAIIAAYEQKMVEYESQLGQLENRVVIKGHNPRQNREIEKLELKKWAIELLTLQRFDGFDAMKKASNGAPEIDFTEAFQEGKFVRFFEQAIEWHNMTYLFYPYFWAHKQRWNTLKQLEDNDEIFTKFLQAGYARVVIPVHPKFTKAMLHYFNSGEIWNGQDLPAIDDDLYLSIIQEIQEMEDITSGDPIGDAWETRVPTNLTMIDGSIPTNLPGS